MKKLLPTIVLILVLLCSVPAMSSTSNANIALTEQQTHKTEARKIEQRIMEIRKMDKSNLSSSEKKGLRNELMALKSKAKDPAGIYISGSALLIIIILLIILL